MDVKVSFDKVGTLLQLPKKVVISKKHALLNFNQKENMIKIKGFFRNIATQIKAFFSRFTKRAEKS